MAFNVSRLYQITDYVTEFRGGINYTLRTRLWINAVL